jgi:ribose-phosphate pyrophosphokinase
MTSPLVVALPGNEGLAESLEEILGGEMGILETRQFPDGESYLRFRSDPARRRVVLVCTLDRPHGKFLRLAFAAAAARELGAKEVGLVAPYLSYMRQDRRFAPGEAVTSSAFAGLLSSAVDWLVTVDPHLHRYKSLGEIYSIPDRVVHSAPSLAAWIRTEIARPLLLGPDAESEQWVSEVTALVGAPFQVLRKTRLGDRNVEIEVPELGAFSDRTPVLVDDIVSSARTIIETAKHLAARGMRPPVCVAVHGLFTEAVFDELSAHASRVVTTNSVLHPSNAIDLAPLIAAAVGEFIGSGRGLAGLSKAGARSA